MKAPTLKSRQPAAEARARDGVPGALKKLHKLGLLIRRVRNWPRTLLDHLLLSSVDYTCYLRDGSSFEVRGGTDDRHMIFELFVERVYDVEISPGGIVVDVGAHIGGFTVAAARRGARVLSYEPFPSSFALLQKNVRRNHLEAVRLFPFAISDHCETRDLFVPADASESAAYSLLPGRGSATISVPCMSLDQVVREHALGHIDLLKLDCEGSEYPILYGASPDTLSRIHRIVAECHNVEEPTDWSAASLQRYLELLGFATLLRGDLLYAERTAPPESGGRRS